MGFNLIFIGFLFTAIPGIGIVDPVPDFIGWMLISRGLSRLCYTDARFSLAKRYSNYLIAANLIKFLLIFTVGMVDDTMLLVYCFSFAVLEIYVGTMWANSFFSGCDYTLSQCQSPVSNLVSEAKFLFLLAVIARAVLTALPEFFSIADPAVTGEYSPGAVISASVFPLVRNGARIAGFVGSFGIGIYSSVKLHFFTKLCRLDKSYQAYLEQKYRENYLNNPSFLISHTVKGAANLVSVGVFFLIGLYIDKVNVIPSTVFFVIAYIALRQIKKVAKVKNSAILLSLAGILVSLAAHALQIYYAVKYVGSYNELFSSLIAPKIIGTATAVITAALLIYIILLVNRIALDYIKGLPSQGGMAVSAVNTLAKRSVFHSSGIGKLCLLCIPLAAALACLNAVVYFLPTTGSLFMTLTALYGLIFGVLFTALAGRINSYEVWSIKHTEYKVD